MKLSIIVPVFDEKNTIRQVLAKLNKLSISKIEIEIIVVDDCSYDGTGEIIREVASKNSSIKAYFHKKNQGKGKAVMTGISYAKGDYIIIQDADLEYDPLQIGKLTSHITNDKKTVVYGTRLNRMPHLEKEEKRFRFLLHYLGNRGLSLITSLLYGQWITDMETCYKLIPLAAFSKFTIHAKGFEFEPEVTAKLIKSGYHIIEVPITTTPRGYEEGKKLQTVRDGLKALIMLVRCLFQNY